MIPNAVMAAFRETLLRGSYNLLLGSGVSLDSRNGRNELLRGSEKLRQDLCALTNAPPTTSLTRAYALLTAQQVKRELVERFSKCQPGPSLRGLPRFLWRRAFTFNIDDVIENLYEHSRNTKQTLVPFNFDTPFEPTPERHELYAVHLHGWVRKPESGFVFSPAEYVRAMSSQNAWMHLLSEILATESFIIAGTSLNEIDLEYYLSYRTPATPRRDRGPSLLIEPEPDVVTRSDCDRYGLTLVRATFDAFMDWLIGEFPSPPSVADLLVPDRSTLFSKGLEPTQLLRFFSDFEMVEPANRTLSQTPRPFLYGSEPTWKDLDEHVDIEREGNALISNVLLGSCDAPAPPAAGRIVLVMDDAGTGKTTSVMRVAHAVASSGTPVLAVRTLNRIDTRNANACLSRSTTNLVLVVDGLADHAEQVQELLEDAQVASRVVVLATERSYRRAYLDTVFGDIPQTILKLPPFTLAECVQLLERYRQFGLVGEPMAARRPQIFAQRILDEPLAVAVCRILNDFRPLDRVVASLWKASDEDTRFLYLCIALAQHCYSGGLRYSLLQAIAGPRNSVGKLLDAEVPLRLALNTLEADFVVPMNAIIAERIVLRMARTELDFLLRAFTGIASVLAPHVNRKAIMRRSPEARLAGRLFDADKIVRPLLGAHAERFYHSIQKRWEWNSRYWEQRALLAAETDLSAGLQYARHAIAIELHPFTLTTLGKLLLRYMETAPTDRENAFDEAFEKLDAAIKSEANRSRITVHPFATLFAGTARYIELGGVLTADQHERVTHHMGEARIRFARDSRVAEAVGRLATYLSL